MDVTLSDGLSHLPRISPKKIITDYDVILLDAYGVIVNATCALPGASEFIAHLHKMKKEYWILSNGCSLSPADSCASYHRKGVMVEEERVITAATITYNLFLQHPKLRRVKILGAPRIISYLSTAGVIFVEDESYSTVLICDHEELRLPEDIDQLITEVIRKHHRQEHVHFLLPNPDKIYPKASGTYGVTSGALMSMIQNALDACVPKSAISHSVLGKPYPPIFEKAQSLYMPKFRGKPKPRIVMVGDQISTDILGGKRQGLDTVLMQTDLTKCYNVSTEKHIVPDYICKSLE